MSVICFHNPNEENGYLSNWYPSPFEMDKIIKKAKLNENKSRTKTLKNKKSKNLTKLELSIYGTIKKRLDKGRTGI